MRSRAALLLALFPLQASSIAAQAVPPPRTQNVILVVTDGVRWQDVFGGADSSFVFGDQRLVGGVTAGVRRKFWRRSAAERREALLPFFWGTIARKGQVFGNRAAGSSVVVTNGLKFSYPGYHEMLAGFA